jgi:hypothetical protein
MITFSQKMEGESDQLVDARYDASLDATLPPIGMPRAIHVLIYETEATFRPQAESLQSQ